MVCKMKLYNFSVAKLMWRSLFIVTGNFLICTSASADFCQDLVTAARYAQNDFASIRGEYDINSYQSTFRLANAPECVIDGDGSWVLSCDWDYSDDTKEKALIDARKLANQVSVCLKMVAEERTSNIGSYNSIVWTVPYLAEKDGIDFKVILSERTSRRGKFYRRLSLEVSKQD